jgi:hypothetical protein
MDRSDIRGLVPQIARARRVTDSHFTVRSVALCVARRSSMRRCHGRADVLGCVDVSLGPRISALVLPPEALATSARTMNIAFYTVVPRLVMPPAMVLTIVVTFLVTLSVTAVMANYLTIVYDTARQRQYQGRQQHKCTGRAKPV